MAISRPTSIARTGPCLIRMVWDDGHVSDFPTSLLREFCGCASCVDEWSGITRIVPGSIPETLDVVECEHVGAYAVRFVFTDAHSDGIYSWQRLRKFCPCEDCADDRGAVRESASERSAE